jgi:hypothetical protein
LEEVFTVGMGGGGRVNDVGNAYASCKNYQELTCVNSDMEKIITDLETYDEVQ